MTLNVSEIFGPTIQGEGTAAGQHCLFLRVFGCNLECNWCDTAYTWATTPAKAAKHNSGIQYDVTQQSKPMECAEVLAQLEKLWPISSSPTMIVISGGEPLMQQRELLPLLDTLATMYCPVHIETAGTIRPTTRFDDGVTQYNVSPKLANSGNPPKKRRKDVSLEFFAQSPAARFKFVLASLSDFEEVDDIVRTHEIPSGRVQVMPEGTTVEQNLAVARTIVDEALARGFGLSLRSHIFLWRDVRGR